MSILNLEEPSSWHPDYNALLESAEVHAIVNEEPNPEEGPPGKWSQFESCESVTDRDVRFTHRRCKEILFGKYTHVVAFHGCRISNPDDYMKRGIRPSDPHTVIQQLIDFAPENRDQIFRAADNCAKYGYIETTKGYVCCLLSEKYALKTKTAYAVGSEYVRRILSEIRDDTLSEKFAATGTPSLIRCRIPVAWLCEDGLGSYNLPIATFPLLSMMQKKKNTRVQIGNDVSILLKFRHVVSPDLIDRIIDMSDVVDDRVLLNEPPRFTSK